MSRALRRIDRLFQQGLQGQSPDAEDRQRLIELSRRFSDGDRTRRPVDPWLATATALGDATAEAGYGRSAVGEGRR